MIPTANKRPSGMFGFTIVWLGQIISVLATNMSTFALTIWVFEKTGSATALGLVGVFFNHAVFNHHTNCRGDG